MTTKPDTSDDPRNMGVITKMLSRVLGHMPAADRTALMQDAATLSNSELGKAAASLNTPAVKADNMMAVDEHSGFVEDHWSDGPVDAVNITQAHGPGSSVPSGSINTGPTAQASGEGAAGMERQYSRHAPQTGTPEAASKLGRDIMVMRSVMKSMVTAMQGFGTQLDVLKANAADTAQITEASIGKAIETAVAKALAPIKAGLLVKADKKDDNWKDEDEDAKSAALIAKADDEKKKKDKSDEDDDESESAKSASELRVMAKSYVDHARLRISKALDYVAEGKAKAAQRSMTLAESNIAKADEYVGEAKALRDGKAGLATLMVMADIAKAKKGIAASVATNQDIWPASSDADVGKGDVAANPPPAATAAASPPSPDLAKAMQQIEAAASGMGMLQASVSDMMQALSQKTVATTMVDGERASLPPVFALAKAGASDLSSREAELSRLRDTSIISFEDFDRARDTLMRVRMNMPADTIQAMVDRLPEPARAVLTRGAA